MKDLKQDFAAAASRRDVIKVMGLGLAAAALPSGMFAGARLAAAQPGDAMPAAGDLS